VRPKNVGKKSSEKSAKTRFLYSQEYRYQKMGEKREKQFFQKHTNSASKKWEKIVVKIAKKVLLYSHEYRAKKRGQKSRETIFPETNE